MVGEGLPEPVPGQSAEIGGAASGTFEPAQACGVLGGRTGDAQVRAGNAGQGFGAGVEPFFGVSRPAYRSRNGSQVRGWAGGGVARSASGTPQGMCSMQV
ncbi:hypothetical protein GCM10023096_18010 [Nonomuraea ferruginea]